MRFLIKIKFSHKYLHCNYSLKKIELLNYLSKEQCYLTKFQTLRQFSLYHGQTIAGVAELADASDSKSDGVKPVWVRVPPPVLCSFTTLLSKKLTNFLKPPIFTRFIFYY